MKNPVCAALFVLCAASLAAQTPAPPATQTHTDPIGFSYTLPGDWEVVDMQPALPAARQQVDREASSAEEKKGADCAQFAFTARHGDPPSIILIVTMTYECYGQRMSDSDLPAFGLGAAQGVSKSWVVVNPQYGAYTLGSHSVWIERTSGNPIGHPEVQRTIEVVCSLLKSGAICWMAMVTDDASLRVFETSQVALDGDPPATLVPANAFENKP